MRNRVALGMACHWRDRGYGATPEQGRYMGLWRFIARGQEFSWCLCGNAKFPFVHEQTTAPAFVTGGQRNLPLNAIVYFLGRLGSVDDGSLAIDLASGLSAVPPLRSTSA